MTSVAYITLVVGILALLINIYGLVVGFFANSRFHGGLNKVIVHIVLVLVVILNIHIILNVYSNIPLVFGMTEALQATLDHIGFILVMVISILAIVASIVNMMMAREQGFA